MLIVLAYPALISAQGGPPPPGLPDEPEVITINCFEEVLLVAAILLAGFVLTKLKKEPAGSSKIINRPKTKETKKNYR